jgi:signal peptidase I
MKKEQILGYVHRTWKEWRLTLLIVLFVVIPVKSSLADWNWVPTGSMNPTILEGDLVFVNKLAYGLRVPLTLHRLARWSDPKRGDIVICFSPEDKSRLVKRVVAEPGDVIEMKNNVLHLNGRAVAYTQMDRELAEALTRELKFRCKLAMEELGASSHAVMSVPSIPARRTFGPVTVPEGHFFVMGDNRDNSRDSRFFGFVEREQIVGQVKGVIASLNITDKYQPRLKRFFSALK